MSRQNTQKQIAAMVILMFLGVASLGAYIWFDDGRRAEAEDGQLIESAERGVRLFANNCRVCHGNGGQGLIGPALNTPANTLAFRAENSGSLAEIQARLRATIECGRNGTAMPPWAEENGGSLNFFHVDGLVTLITTNSGNAWEEALALAIEEDEIALIGLESVLAEAQSRATPEGIAAAINSALDAANDDARAVLLESVSQLARAVVAAQLDDEFGERISNAKADEDEAAIEQLVAEKAVREAELFDEAAAAALSAAGGDALRALTAVRTDLAAAAAVTAAETLDGARERVEAGRPIQVATPSLTQGTCGQRVPG
jgi:mono/diheme cytochrome c family protein